VNISEKKLSKTCWGDTGTHGLWHVLCTYIYINSCSLY